jgi:hypothetical protein
MAGRQDLEPKHSESRDGLCKDGKTLELRLRNKPDFRFVCSVRSRPTSLLPKNRAIRYPPTRTHLFCRTNSFQCVQKIAERQPSNPGKDTSASKTTTHMTVQHTGPFFFLCAFFHNTFGPFKLLEKGYNGLGRENRKRRLSDS